MYTREDQKGAEARYRAKLRADSVRMEARRVQQRQWRKSDPERERRYELNKNARLRERKPWVIAFKSAARRARVDGIPFNLTKEWAENEHRKGSALSGLPFAGEIGAYAPSIDRIDPAKGYVVGNARMILHAENLFKNRWTDDVVIEIARAIVERANQ